MKKLTFLLLFFIFNTAFAAEPAEKPADPESTPAETTPAETSPAFPVRLHYKSDLIKDLPIDLSFITTGQRINFLTSLETEPEIETDPGRAHLSFPATLSINARMFYHDDGSLSVETTWQTTTASARPPNHSVDFKLNSTVRLKPDEEQILLDLMGRKLIIGLSSIDQ